MRRHNNPVGHLSKRCRSRAWATGESWHRDCDSNFMNLNPSPAVGETLPSTKPAPQGPEVFHSLQDLPVSVGQVSKGPLGAVERRDHTSWKTKNLTDPAFWSGRLDSALGNWIKDRPIPRIAVCVGIGALVGMIYSFREDR